MSFKNFLDLRKKTQPQIKIVERIILRKRSIKSDLFLALSVILVASGVIWGISKADGVNPNAIANIIRKANVSKEERKTFSTRGQVSEVNGSSIVISNAKNPKGEEGFSYTVDLEDASIKSSDEQTLMLPDVKVNQEVVAKGILSGNTIFAHTLIIFGEALPATTTATTTPETATTTEETATSTATATPESTTSTSTASTTPSIIETITNFVSGVIDSIMGTSTATSTENTSTTTSTTTDESASTTSSAPSVIPAEAGIQSENSGSGHDYFSAEKSLDPDSTRQSPSLSSGPTPNSTPGVPEDDNAGGNDNTTENSNSDSILDSVTNTIGNMTGAVTDAVSNIVDVIRGTTIDPVVEPVTPEEQTISEPAPEISANAEVQ